MTATITKTTSNYDDGSATHLLSARSSTPTSGTLQNLRGAWWFISLGGTVLYRHHGLEWVHTALTNGERADLLLICNDGTVEWATPVTMSVGSTFAWHKYVNASTGSSGGTGDVGDPYDTIETALAALRAAYGTVAAAGAEYMIELSNETHAHGTVTGGYVWNQNTLANGTGSAYPGRLTFRGAGSSCLVTVPGSGVGVVNNQVNDAGFASIDVTWQGDFVSGGAAHSGTAFNSNRGVAGGNGVNFTFCGGGIEGFDYAVNLTPPFSGTTDAEVLLGEFDWFCVQDAAFGDTYSYHCGLWVGQKVGVHRCTFGNNDGSGTGSTIRAGFLNDSSIGQCTFDRTASPYTGNTLRINGTTTANGGSNRVSISGLVMRGVTEGIEIEQPSGTIYINNYWFHGCHIDLDTTGSDTYPFGFYSTTSNTVDATNVRFTACSARTQKAGTCFMRFQTHSSATTEKIHSVALEQCSVYLTGAYGGFSFSASLIYATGVNYDNDSVTIRGCYAYCAETLTDFSRPVSFFHFVDVTAADVIADSDYNVSAKLANGGGTAWNNNQTRAAWETATGFDSHSYELENEASHNFTNVTLDSWDATPASGTGPQMGRGYPGLVYAGSDRRIFDTSAPDAGALDHLGTVLSDPTFGGGTVPDDPTDVVVTALSSSSLQVDWTDNASDETAYVVEYKLTSEPTTWTLWDDAIAANAETTTITGLSTLTAYDVRVRARNGTGDSGNATGSGTTLDVAPTAPSGITLTPGHNSVLVEWTDNASNETAYEVDYKLTSEPTTWTTWDHGIAANATSTTVTGLTPETGYDFRVRAVNAVGNSSYDSDSTTTTAAPAAPDFDVALIGTSMRLRLGMR